MEFIVSTTKDLQSSLEKIQEFLYKVFVFFPPFLLNFFYKIFTLTYPFECQSFLLLLNLCDCRRINNQSFASGVLYMS